MYYPDLAHCNKYFHEKFLTLLAVGWLEPNRQFEVGRLEKPVFDRIVHAYTHLRSPAFFLGCHYCELCGLDSDGNPRSWSPSDPALLQYPINESCLLTGDLFIPDSGTTFFVASSLLVHYVNRHNYLPPQEFQSALMRCPDIRSQKYTEILLEKGLGLST